MTRQVNNIVNSETDANHCSNTFTGTQLPVHVWYDRHDINYDEGDGYDCVDGNDYILGYAEHGNECKANGDDHALLHGFDKFDLHDDEAPVEACRLNHFVNPIW